MELKEFFAKFAFLWFSLILGGCSSMSVMNDITPSRVPKNQSRIYTITMSVNKTSSDLRKKGIKPYIVINGERHEMKPGDSNNTYFYDYKAPSDVPEMLYYYELIQETMDSKNNLVIKSVEKSEVFNLSINDKYILTMDCERGPVGAKVCILGSGFSSRDMIRIGGVPAKVKSVSKGAIEFIIPLVDAETSYDVILISGGDRIFIGKFFVDISELSADVESITLDNGKRMILSFFIDHDAPEGGLPLDITTDIPDSIIMPEVSIPEDSSSVEVEIEGGSGNDVGSLFVYASGFNELKIPITVGDQDIFEEKNKSTGNKYNGLDVRREDKQNGGPNRVNNFTFDDKVDSDMVVVR
ncbi:MAG: IPT/TIG domain-containing protein [Puniceicoccales bacterium]|jgi:hypothetical protein|nr:IPT/TIG domain-containing protein [Puniceicoccales bacterium]